MWLTISQIAAHYDLLAAWRRAFPGQHDAHVFKWLVASRVQIIYDRTPKA